MTAGSRPPAAVPTRAELEAMRARCEAATPGPWRAIIGEEEDNGGDLILVMGEHHEALFGNLEGSCGECHANHEFCARARSLLPALLAAVEALAAERDALRAALAEVVEHANDEDAWERGKVGAIAARALAAAGEGVDAGG